jgi:Putative zinc-finger
MSDVLDVDGHVRGSLGAYVMGDLRGAPAEGVEAHLDRCGACSLELRDLRTATVALALLKVEEAEELTGMRRMTVLSSLGGSPPRRSR